MTTSRQIRARFAQRLSVVYGREVPLYTTLVDVSQAVNRDVIEARGDDALKLGGVGRVTAERHGAIRVGTAEELNQVGRIFAAMGMHPVGFYDLRETKPDPVPVVSTAFRPIDADELEFNPFRVFTSVLTPDDDRFFDQDLQQALNTFLGRRKLFPADLLPLADRLAAEGELPERDGERFLDLAASAFELSPEPVDQAWYRRLEKVSSVAADIGGVTTTHINHLTPRVLDIDELYRRMTDLGVTMIPAIQGPPRWAGPDVLLRQTSFRALDEQRMMRHPDGRVEPGTLRVRFGEVEQRGIALTPKGRDLIDTLAPEEWDSQLPHDELVWREQGLAYFRGSTPIVYEDFLPRSAAGIFSSNLTGAGSMDTERAGSARDAAWMAEALQREVLNGDDLYEAAARP